MIPVYYNPMQSVRENDSFSPSAGKPEQVVAAWRELALPLIFPSFAPATRDQIKWAHESSYVDAVLDGRVNNGFGNRSPAIAQALPWVCGSMLAAALCAYERKMMTFSPTSGAHHAGYGFGGGFCTFNSLMIAALGVHKAGAARVGIVDCDMHHGNGTENIIRELGVYFVQHHSFAHSGAHPQQSDDEFISEFTQALMLFRGCDLVIYNAGADPHVDDPLGGILTTEQMRMRDFLFFLHMKEFRIPVVTALAGGYQRDSQGSIDPVLKLHNNTILECWRVISEY